METVTVPKVYGAIAKVAKLISKEGIAKDRENTFQKYKFRGIDDVYNALAPFLSEAQLCILPRYVHREMIEREKDKGGVQFHVVVVAEFDFVSAEDGSKHTISMYGEAMDSSDKATNKAMSAAYKYACMQTFCIPTEGDNDADAHHPEPGRKKEAPKPAPPEPSEQDRILEAQLKEAKAKMLHYFPGSGEATFKRYCKAHGLTSAIGINPVQVAKVLEDVQRVVLQQEEGVPKEAHYRKEE